jgi:NNP family nitrate/nitrite transporter-like MFS transporter
VVWFTVLMFVLGIAFAFGKASTFKYISDEFPHNIGAISGIVGLAGGLGGFALPILFGLLVDLTGIRSSAFMLLYGVVWVSLIWMYLTEVRRTDVMTAGVTLTTTGIARDQSSRRLLTRASNQASSQAGTPS